METRTYQKIYDENIRKHLMEMKNTGFPVCFLSMDTTGLDPEKDEIIRIGVVSVGFTGHCFEVSEHEHFSFLVHPEHPVPKKISKINGITNEDLSGASPIEVVMRQVYEKLGSKINIIGWNTEKFLVPFLKNAGFNSGYMIYPVCRLDLMNVSRSLLPQSKKLTSYSSFCVARFLDIYKDGMEKEIMYQKVYDALIPEFPSGTEQAKVISASLWKKSSSVRFIFFETDHGKVALNCNTGFWHEQTPGFFDTVDMDGLTDYILKKRNVADIWTFIQLYEK